VSRATGGPPPVRLRTESAEDTRALGVALAAALRPGDMVLLAGDLGAGKTTLAQGIGAGLGVADHLTSPTFTLVRSYPCPVPVDSVSAAGSGSGNGRVIRTLLHADLYRLENLAEVADLAIAELVEDDAVALVEWGDVAGPVLGDDAITVRLAEGAVEDERSVRITVAGRSAPRHEVLGLLLAQWVAP
jgi:tRNA threonylcarbamoyladenosine biosynthesis protein TsaE